MEALADPGRCCRYGDHPSPWMKSKFYDFACMFALRRTSHLIPLVPRLALSVPTRVVKQVRNANPFLRLLTHSGASASLPHLSDTGGPNSATPPPI